METIIKGFGFDKCFFVQCQEPACENNVVNHRQIFSGPGKQKGCYSMNLNVVYQSLIEDSGFRGAQRISHGHNFVLIVIYLKIHTINIVRLYMNLWMIFGC